jgi:hypothetical protein
MPADGDRHAARFQLRRERPRMARADHPDLEAAVVESRQQIEQARLDSSHLEVIVDAYDSQAAPGWHES